MGRKNVSDEVIASALLTCGSIANAAAKCGVSTRCIRDRMKDGTFRELYASAKADIMRTTVAEINQHVCDAVRVMSNIMQDNTVNAQVRLLSARSILDTAVRLSGQLDTADAKVRIEEQKTIDSIWGI